MQEFVDCFDDGKVQYGFARVIDPNSNLPKFVLVGWIGEGIPEHVKGHFNAHFSTIASYFRGYHVQIIARSQDDLTVSQILKKVSSASGANYSANSSFRGALSRKPQYAQSSTGASEDDWGDAPPVLDDGKVSHVTSAYKPTKVDISAIKASATEPSSFSSKSDRDSEPASKPEKVSIPKPSFSKPEVVKGSYTPIGKVDIEAIRAQAQDNRFNPKPEPLQSSYKPIGKVDISALRANANKKEEIESSASRNVESKPKFEPKPKPTPEEEPNPEDDTPKSVHDRMKAFNSKPAVQDDDEDEDYRPKSLKERMNAFQNAERLTDLPKPKTKNSVASRFSPAASRAGTTPPLPKSEFSSSKPNKDFVNDTKSPAQLWAEKQGKYSSAPVEQEEVEEVQSKFAHTSISQESKPDSDDEEEDISDLKAKFVANFAKPAQSKPEPTPPSLPTRSVPPPPPADIPTPPTRNLPPADFPPPPSRSVPPPPKEEEEEEEEAPALPSRHSKEESPALPARNEPVPDLPKRNLPPIIMAPGATPPLPGSSTGAPSLPPRVATPEPEPEPEVEEEEEPAHTSGLDHIKLPMNAIVLYEYVKDEDNELNLAESQIVDIVGFPDEQWWQARNIETGEEGLVPADYVQLLKGTVAVAEYDYKALEDNEISFPEGAYITDIDQVEIDWWFGTYAGEQGLFPANYVALKK